ncbi:MAG: hypothetical protein LUH06_03405, partial [Oscillospiraceae bacterium]|nr:hypothetical protein [Oscillospiraceae bacterium]
MDTPISRLWVPIISGQERLSEVRPKTALRIIITALWCIKLMPRKPPFSFICPVKTNHKNYIY